jgi:hypothetical protein
LQAPTYDQLQINNPQRYFVHSEGADTTATGNAEAKPERQREPQTKAEVATQGQATPSHSAPVTTGASPDDSDAWQAPQDAAAEIVAAYDHLLDAGLGAANGDHAVAHVVLHPVKPAKV